MKLYRILFSFVAAASLFASCKDVQRDFAEDDQSGGMSSKGGARSGGAAGDSSSSGGNAGSDAGGAGPDGSGGAGASSGAEGGGAGGTGGSDCTPDARRCSEDVPEACSADGAWEATEAGCAFGCVAGACNDCEEGMMGCESGQAKSCLSGQWQFTACESQCEAGECVDTCTEGTRQCDGLAKVQVCEAGVFVDESECEGICALGECVGECKPDASRCAPGSGTTVQLCSAQGDWGSAVCSGATTACLGGACVACTPGSARCSAEGRPQTCTEFGSWADEAPCAGETPACVTGECRLCEPGARRCNAGRPQQCNTLGTAWVDGAACSGATPACVAATGQCGTCRAGDRQCGNGTTPQLCDASGRWNDEARCATASPVCLGGECAQCQPNSRRCVGVTPQLCSSNGAWVAQPACAGATPSCIPSTGQCGCSVGALDCLDSNTPTACSAAGAWVAQADCRGDTPVCAAGACQCAEGTVECTSATTPRRCAKGVWESTTCSGATPVCVAGACRECTPNAARCAADGSHVQEICSAEGLWKRSANCAFCSKGQCGNPAQEPGVIGCDAASGLVCRLEACCLSPDGPGVCQGPLTKCTTRDLIISCDGPSDCDARSPICCAVPAVGTGCTTAATCALEKGSIVCDPEKPACPERTTCLRAGPNLFTCQ